jgi:cleavage and polyadenylation specificity factor subunit 4
LLKHGRTDSACLTRSPQGNCKFGPKCANIHVLPDGRRINYGKNGVTIGAPPGVTLGVRVNPTTYHPPSNSALTNSFLRAGSAVPPYAAPTSAYAPQDDPYGHQLGRQPSMENGLPVIDTTSSSNPASAYGSPRDEDTNRLGLGLSPVNTAGLSVLDAPLPASFDSNGISLAARYGPFPASVPAKFGLESPSPSLHAARDGRTSETLKMLHNSAFGSSEHLSPSALGAADANGFGSSPSVGSAAPGSAYGSDEYFGKRTMHSTSLRYAKPRLVSSSVPKIDRDWEAEFMFEEDYVPGSLANEVLTPAEKARRGSNTANTMRMTDTLEPAVESLPAGATKFGSPGMAASPSRWGPLFQRHKDDDLDVGSPARSMKHVSAFGHVGSPLRNSSLASAITAESRADTAAGSDTHGEKENGMESISALTRQLRETRLAEGGSGSAGPGPQTHPTVPRSSSKTGGTGGSGGAGIIGREREKDRALERHVSSGSTSSGPTGRFATPIDEEDSSFVFRMEEEDDAQQARTTQSRAARKRASGGNPGVASPLSGVWSYANVVASNRGSTGAGTSANGGGKPAAGSGAVEAAGAR